MTLRTDAGWFAWAILLVLPLVGGCGAGSGTVRVAGEVTYEGKPLTTGLIVFTPFDPAAAPATGGDIVDGKYDVPADKGIRREIPYHVRITALRKSGKFIPNPVQAGGPPVETDEQFLPTSYNTLSILKIKADSATSRFDFALNKEGTNPLSH